MPRFYMAYHVTRDVTDPAEQAQQQARYDAWIQKHTENLVVPVQPLGAHWLISTEGAREEEESTMMGFSILEAADLDAAKSIAADCPFCDIGQLQLAEMLVMPPSDQG